ncbi:MAG TPA: CAAX prenyl protease-related protein [Bryobacteraceae bacterium]|nr:CAAX prenyl protease-related protein [Bryobacteraceae bacterium]
MGKNPTAAYTAPFLVYIAFLAVQKWLPFSIPVVHAIRFVVVLAVIWVASRRYLSLRPSYPLASIGIGIAVFLIWVGPDYLFGYRHFWLFENAITGTASSGFPESLRHDRFFILVRILTTAALVPVLEELFWRGWLMRWLINNQEFLKVPLGTFQPLSFWLVAVLFASEHGSYWEVGLAAGIIYNWWILHTKNLADCILAHAVTNGILALYVLEAGQWQYWL